MVRLSLAKHKELCKVCMRSELVSMDDMNLARDEVQLWLERNEIMGTQRSKALWLKECDMNTKYFHMKASQRRRKNSILKIQDDNGDWQEGFQRDRIILDCFQGLFTSSN